MTTEDAIKHLNSYVGNDCYTDFHQEICRMAVAALQAQPAKLDRGRWEGCEECSKPWCGTCIRYNVRNIDAICTFGCVDFSRFEPNNFCKLCGRPLTEDAWAKLERRIAGNNDA